MRTMLLVAVVAACGLEACTSKKPAQLDSKTEELCPPDAVCCPRCPSGTVCTDGSCEPVVTCHCPTSTTCARFGCDTTTGDCIESDAPTTTSCNDGNLCTLGDHCDGLGSCVASTTCQTTNTCVPPNCDGTSCNFTQLAAGSMCNDGNSCTYGDTCDASANCAGTPITCNSNICQTSSCNGTSSCSVTTLSGCACALSYNRFVSETGSAISAADAPNYGHWQAGSFSNTAAKSDVYAVKTANTASGNVEVDVLSGSNSFQVLQSGPVGGPLTPAHYVTPIPVATAGDYRWAITNFITGTAGQSAKSLVAIRVQNTASGKVEVSVLDGNQKMAVYSLQNSVTPIPISDAPNLRFVTGDIGNSATPAPGHIYVIRVAGSASGKVELSWLDWNTQYTTLTTPAATAIPISDAPFFAGWGMARYPGLCSGVSDTTFDLFGFKTQNTAGNVEVHVLDGTNLMSYLHLTTSAITRLDAPNFVWSVDYFTANSTPDVYAIKLRNTGTGQAEVHVLSGAP